MDIAGFFNQGWVGIAIGSILSIGTYIKSMRRAAPKVTINASHELTWADSIDLPPGLELKFRNKSIPHIARGVVRFWNGGNETLEGNLVPKQDKLSLTIPDGEFLLVAIPKTTNSANKCEIQIDANDKRVAYFNFDFLDPDEGAVIGFLHSSKTAAPEFKGTIKGHKIKILEQKIQSKARQRLYQRFQSIKKFIPYPLLLSGSVLLAASLLPNESLLALRTFLRPNAENIKEFGQAGRSIYAIAGFGYLVFGVSLIWKKRKKHPKSLDLPAKK
jgi:hypothetical protein